MFDGKSLDNWTKTDGKTPATWAILDGGIMQVKGGNIITKQRPDFDSRNYGYAKLSDLITATTLFELDRRSPGDGKPAVIYTRDKRRSPDE